jgi:hypothetical protein
MSAATLASDKTPVTVESGSIGRDSSASATAAKGKEPPVHAL